MTRGNSARGVPHRPANWVPIVLVENIGVVVAYTHRSMYLHALCTSGLGVYISYSF